MFFSVAVSIDALAIGLSFYLENVAVFFPVLIAGLTAAILTLLGLFVGRKKGVSLGRRWRSSGD